MKLTLPVILLLLSEVMLGQSLEKRFLAESKQVVDAFYELYGDTTVTHQLPKIKFKDFGRKAGPIKKKVYSSGKGAIVNQTIKYYIKPYKHLRGDDRYQVTLWAKKMGYTDREEEFYYTLVVYWVLPRTLSQLLLPPNTVGKKVNTTERNETLDEYTLHFLLKSSYLRKLKSFEFLVETIKSQTRQRIGSETYTNDLIKGRKRIRDFTQFWHIHAWSMQQVIQKAKG